MPAVREKIFKFYSEIVMKNYLTLDSGLEQEDWDILVMDTGSDLPEFNSWLKATMINFPNLKRIPTPNHGGAFAGIKHAMHGDDDILDSYEYFNFHVDDGVEPVGDNWAKHMIGFYEDNLTDDHAPMLMGRQLDTIVLGPRGLTQHRNCCPHVGEMWGMEEDVVVPHLHGDWWFLDALSLDALRQEWYNPVKSDSAMAYQKLHENVDFKSLHELNDNRETLDNIHIGREVDVSLRMQSLLKGKLLGYIGTKINAKQLHHRLGCV